MSKHRDYLRKRPTYGDMINEIEIKQPRIKFPDRRATFLRNTHYLSQFDGDQSFINLEEQENNIAKEQIIQQELRRISRTLNTTHTGLLADASSPKVTASLPSDYDTADELQDIQQEQSSRELMARAKQANASEKNRLNLLQLSRQETSDMEQFQTPRENTNNFTSEPKVQEILSKVQKRFRQKGPEVTAMLGNAGSGLLSLAGTAGSGALSLAGTVGSGALNVAKVAGPIALDVAGAVGSGALNIARVAGPIVLDTVMIGSDNFMHNLSLATRDLLEISDSSVRLFLYSAKPTFRMIANALHEGMYLYQNVQRNYQRTLPPSDYSYSLGGGSSSSSSSIPISYTPFSTPPRAQQSHGTGYESYNTVDEWLRHYSTKGGLFDQLTKRNGYEQLFGIVNASGYYTKDAGKQLRQKIGHLKKEEIAELILMLDGKRVY